MEIKKIFIKTYGCAANQSDSEAMMGLLKEKGYSLAGSENDADFIIVNTCSVKNKTQSKELHYIRDISKNKKVIVGGCLTKSINIRKYSPRVTAVFDTNSLTKLHNILENPHDEFSDKKESGRLNLPIVRIKNNIGLISIGQGCVNNCSFCSTKLARGNLMSYRIGDIYRALEGCINDDCKLIYITSQDNGAYGLDIKTDLISLLTEILQIEGDFKIRIGMANPWHIKRMLPGLIQIYKNKKIIKFLHIPVQSGSNKILKEMKRTHTTEDFVYIAERFREEIPNITIATDIIVGYPTEKEEDFQQTLSLIKKIKPEVINMSKFSSRPGTKASKLKQLNSEVIDSRSKKLAELYNNYKLNKNKEELIQIID